MANVLPLVLVSGQFQRLQSGDTLSAGITGNAATVTTNANITGAVTSVGNATSLGSFSSASLLAALTDETGTGVSVFNTSPTFVTQITTPVVFGSSAVGGNLQLTSTSDPTKGFIYFGSGSGYDGTKMFLGLGTQTPAALLHLAGNITATAWTTSGIGLRISAATYTDSSSSGTVASMYINTFGVGTIASSSTTTFTSVATAYFDNPVASTNVTITNAYSAIFNGNVRFTSPGGQTQFSFGNGLTIVMGNSQNYGLGNSSGISYHSINTTGKTTFTSTTQSSGTQATWTFTQPIYTGGSASGLLFTAGAHTGQTASTEITDINFNLSASLTMADGTVANQRSVRMQGRTYNKTTTLVTLTKASTLSVSSPVAGTGVTITTNAAIECDGNLLLPTAGNGLWIKQGTNATAGRGTLVGGTLTVNTNKATSTSEIFITDRGGTVTNLGTIYVSAVNSGVSFTVTSSNILDVSTFSWFIIDAAP